MISHPLPQITPQTCHASSAWSVTCTYLVERSSPHDLGNEKVVRNTGASLVILGHDRPLGCHGRTISCFCGRFYCSSRATHQQIPILPLKWPPSLLVDVSSSSDEMSRSPVDIDIENHLESPTAVTAAQHSTTRWLPRPNFPNFWTENKSNFDHPKYADISATYWKLCGSEAEIYDENFVDTLKGNTQSMVFLNSLFSSIVGE